ncbi:hypothetical protein P879_02131 [Paragonimus westermani]|uniref:Anion exchange protein n=1 Tax=Paragonimus westermani TaxID=34504 RepID=A0A8T0DEB0_9TREM|nr:hypothetical protein P879_02131 [Paragonimus westermani]
MLHDHVTFDDVESNSRDKKETAGDKSLMFTLGDSESDGKRVHQVFCEMDELWHDSSGSGEMEWREAARWIKFEEDVEENGERWSKPYVATLPVYSVFGLRNSLANAVILIGVEANSMEQIAEIILRALVDEDHVPLKFRECLIDILLRRHVHLYERVRSRTATTLPLIRSLADIGKRFSSKDIDKELTGQQPLGKPPATVGSDHHSSPATHAQTHATGCSDAASGSLQGRFDLHFFKKVPPGAEAANIMVGETVFLTTPITVFIRLREAVILSDLTEVPVPTRFMFVHLGVAGNALKYRQMGRSMGVLMSDEVFREVAYKAKSREDLLVGLDEFLSAATLLPPGEWDPSIRLEPPASVPSQDCRKVVTTAITSSPDHSANFNAPLSSPEESTLTESVALLKKQPKEKSAVNSTGNEKQNGHSSDSHLELAPGEADGGGYDLDDESEGHGLDPALQRTGRLFGGLIQDIKRRAPYYLSDITDAFHVQCFASFVFLYFACLTPIITFGGLLSHATGGYLGTIESILSGAVVGILYALFSGQPLTIMGSTGPVLIFEGIVYGMCHRLEWDYLSFRLWIGLWIAFFLFTIVAFDLSALVKYITRFTEESFAALIAFIFIVEAIKKTYMISKYYRLDLGWSPELMPRHNCSCEAPANLTDAQVLHAMYEDYPLMEVPLIDSNGTKLHVSGSHADYLEFVSMSVDWENISDGRFSWESQTFRELCVDLNGTWTGTDCAPFYVPDVFFFSCILVVATFVLAVGLKSLRNSSFFPAKIRVLISDFSVLIAITLATLTDSLLGLHTPKLQVPDEFSPTLGYKRRGWLVPFFGRNPWWTAIAALGPSLLATILIFLDQQITAVIVNRKENKLKKGAAYHLDLLVLSVTIVINSVLGIPWFVAATVLTINHVQSLKKESESSAPGEKPIYLGCREQRVTGFLIFLSIGLSVFMTVVLGRIPMAVLYGIFLFMGISSLRGVQMMQRIQLLLMPVKYQPDYSFLRHVPLRRVHLFTAVQVGCFAMLWVIKSVDVISILFPIMVLGMCFIRKLLDFVFTYDELRWLDQVLPGSNPRRQKGKVYRVTSVPEMHIKDGKPLSNSAIYLNPKEQRLNITEEVSKTSMWMQLSGDNEHGKFN